MTKCSARRFARYWEHHSLVIYPTIDMNSQQRREKVKQADEKKMKQILTWSVSNQRHRAANWISGTGEARRKRLAPIGIKQRKTGVFEVSARFGQR